MTPAEAAALPWDLYRTMVRMQDEERRELERQARRRAKGKR